MGRIIQVPNRKTETVRLILNWAKKEFEGYLFLPIEERHCIESYLFLPIEERRCIKKQLWAEWGIV